MGMHNHQGRPAGTKWVEFSVSVDTAAAPAIAAVMDKYGRGGAITEEWPTSSYDASISVIRIYLPADAGLNEVRERLHDEFKRLRYPYSISARERLLEPGEWLDAWRKHFKTFEVGESLVVKPVWDSREYPAKKVIAINPGMAFGTGLHPTTRLCLLRLAKHVRPGMDVLDLGTGSAILAIAAARMGAAAVLALDTDPIAVKEARENTAANGLSAVIEVRKGTLDMPTRRRLQGRFDLALANITARVISGLTEHLALVLKPSGRLIVGGISARGLDEILIRLSLAGLSIEAIDREGEWHTITASAGGKQV